MTGEQRTFFLHYLFHHERLLPDMPVNAGEVSNRGIELDLGYTVRYTRTDFTISANFSSVKNRLESLSEGIEEFNTSSDDGLNGSYRTAVGYPIGYFYGYNAAGVYQNPTDADAALPDAVSGTYAEAGDVIFQDNNGPALDGSPAGQQFSGQPDGKIDTQDRTYLGKTIPGYFYGLSIGANQRFDSPFYFRDRAISKIQSVQKKTRFAGLGRTSSREAKSWTARN